MTPAMQPTAYCGPPPTPADLLWMWNPDIVAIALAAMMLALHWRFGSARTSGVFATGTALMLLLFVSPLCALTVALFSARIAHHVLLVAVVAPLLALAFRDLAPKTARVPLAMPVALHALILWFWHVPEIYSIAIVNGFAYWAMQFSLLGSALLMWQRILSLQTPIGAAMLALLASVVQMGMLGALLTFARQPLYEPHFLTTLPYGLSPLEDQQLGGLIMWVPAALPYVAAAMLLLGRQLGRQAIGEAVR